MPALAADQAGPHTESADRAASKAALLVATTALAVALGCPRNELDDLFELIGMNVLPESRTQIVQEFLDGIAAVGSG